MDRCLEVATSAGHVALRQPYCPVSMCGAGGKCLASKGGRHRLQFVCCASGKIEVARRNCNLDLCVQQRRTP
jgi:hypothetical protein